MGNSYYGNAMSRDSSLTDKFFTGEDNPDFGINSGNSTSPTDTTSGIKASDYLNDSGSNDSSALTDSLSKVTLGGLGSAVKGVASIWDAYNKKQYQDKVFGMEEKRVARQTKKEDDAQAGLNAAWA